MAAPPPPGMNLDEDIRGTIIGPVVTLMTLATIFVVLRITSRLTTNLQLQWDDHLILLALIFAYGTGAITIIACHYGLGRHIWSPAVNVEKVMKTLWAYEWAYGAVVPTIKLSIIMFYHRIFPIRSVTYILSFCAFLVISWWLAVYVICLVQCRPISFFWMQYIDPTAQGQCIDIYKFFIGNGAASVITDFIILLVPLPNVWQLQMPAIQKLAVCGIFLLGGFVCIAGIVRVHFLTFMGQGPDLTWNMAQAFIWSSVEPCIGIVSACLPTLRPLVRRCFPRWFTRSKRSGATPNYTTDPSLNFKSQNGEFYRLQDSMKRASRDDEVGLTNEIDMDHSPKGPEGPLNAISIRRDIEWSSTTNSTDHL
ncbi:hypothetical protein VTN00DRAFT_2420 [Thermoascus crustaceus]|uniref:uncharacterized protein n=1 Tax=Thermoascus crustaceus TaxID=5088 RepID=UPI00374454A7